MGDRIAILNDGRLQQIATPLECYHEPANQFVAGFLGEPSMNFFDAENRDGALVTDAFEYLLSPGVAADVEGHRELVFGVRPEAVELVGAATEAHAFEMTVDVVEPMGDENTVYLTFDDAPSETDTLVATTSGMREVDPGQRVAARIPEDAIHLFDRASGDALHNRSVERGRVAEVGPE